MCLFCWKGMPLCNDSVWKGGSGYCNHLVHISICLCVWIFSFFYPEDISLLNHLTFCKQTWCVGTISLLLAVTGTSWELQLQNFVAVKYMFAAAEMCTNCKSTQPLLLPFLQLQYLPCSVKITNVSANIQSSSMNVCTVRSKIKCENATGCLHNAVTFLIS